MPERGRALRLRATAFTHEGAVRVHNEDTVAVDDWVMSEPMHEPVTLERIVEAPVICLVADGMGGHAAGDVASRLVAESLTERAAEATDASLLDDLIRDVEAQLFRAMRERPVLGGMGTTVAGLHLAPGAISVFNVGDSRVYRIEEAGLRQLSTDDTPGPKLADGRTAAHSTALLTQSLGGALAPTGMTPHLLEEPAEGDRRYLICSDGLTDLLSLEALAGHIGPSDTDTVTALFQAAMAAGGHDNISIVLAQVRPA